MVDNYIVVKLKYIVRAEIDGKLKVTLISVCVGVMYLAQPQVNMMFVMLL
jgi:hypothetical protein